MTDVKLYHLSKEKYIDSILKNGIICNPPVRNWLGEIAPLNQRVYLCLHPLFAGDAFIGNDSASFLVKHIDINHLVMDEDNIYPYWKMRKQDLYTEETKKPQESTRKWLGRITLEMGACGGLAGLFLNGTCAYLDDISPKDFVFKGTNIQYVCFQSHMTDWIPLQKAHSAKMLYLKTLLKMHSVAKDVVQILKKSNTPIKDLCALEQKRITKINVC